MTKIAVEVARTLTVNASLATVYRHFWDVVTTSRHIPGLASCDRVGNNTYRLVYHERAHGPVKVSLRYTVCYDGNAADKLSWQSTSGEEDNTDVHGGIKLKADGPKATRIEFQQTMAPEVPVPRLMQALARPIIAHQAADSVDAYLASVKADLERGGRGRKSA